MFFMRSPNSERFVQQNSQFPEERIFVAIFMRGNLLSFPANIFCWQKAVEYLTGKINRRHVKMFSQIVGFGDNIDITQRRPMCIK